MRCPLMVTAGMLGSGLYQSASASSSALTALGDVLGRAGALLLVAPLPLREVVVGALQAPLRGELVDALHEARAEATA